MGHKTILMVEDNPDDVELAVREFKKNNLLNNVVVTRDGVEALDYLFCVGAYVSRDVKDLPLVVLLDLRLPRLDGIDVLRCLRSDERTKDLPVVMLTTSKQEQDMVATHNLGVSGYVLKPVDFVQLTDAIRESGLHWLILKEPPPIPGSA